MELFNVNGIYEEFKYPTSYLKAIELNLVDCDDIVCFEVEKDSKVQIIHDFASGGYEQRNEYKDFWDWMKAAIDELIEEGDM